MRKLRWISILLLVAGASALGFKLRADWRSFHAANDPAAIKVRPLPPAQILAATSAPDYAVVAQQNPFHPERNDAMPPPPQPAVARIVGPPPLVYGSMLLGKEKYALMGTEGDPKPRRVNEGEQFSGYKLAEVKGQSVVLETDGSKSEVMFYNALSRLPRERAKTEAPAGPTAAQVNTPPPPVAVIAPEQAGALPPASAAAPKGKVLVQTPFGPIWQDAKQ